MSSIEPATTTQSQVQAPSTTDNINQDSDDQQEVENGSDNDLDAAVPEIPTFSLVPGEAKKKTLTFKGLQPSTQKSPKENLTVSDEKKKRKMISKHTFESDFNLQQTGRFEEEQKHKDPKTVKVLKQESIKPYQDSPEVQVKEFNRVNSTEGFEQQENEMRETSYFKHTDEQPQPAQSISELISINNQAAQQPIVLVPSTSEGKQIFKLSSKQVKARASRKQITKQDNRSSSLENEKIKKADLQEISRSNSYQIKPETEELKVAEDDSPPFPKESPRQKLDNSNLSNSPQQAIQKADLEEIKKVHVQMEHNENITGNFGNLKITKQTSNNANHNYSALKGEQEPQTQQQMFTSMSDIGFPNSIHGNQPNHNKKKTGELISADQIQRMMDTQNNWRVRTKCIDEMLKDVKDRIQTGPDYILQKSEQLVDFFVKLLPDQNFKIVLNTLNILNMVICMPQQASRQKLNEQWGLSNPSLSRHIPLIVKKLADSKAIIRQEAIKCLHGIFEIMRSTGTRKDNNFIALILPYLNNSSNWHIREELLHVLIKCFLKAEDPIAQFDPLQILDSVLQLFNDTKEKIRNLSLEALATFACIGFKDKILEIMFRNNVEKDIIELVTSRLEYGMFPQLNNEGVVEIPYQEQLANFDVDSVAHSIANQSNQQSYEQHQRRKPSVGGGSQSSFQQNQVRGNSSGRKIVVATANATNQQLINHQDDIIQQAYLQQKRTASANNPAQFEMEQHPNDPNFVLDAQNSFTYSIGAGTNHKRDMRMMPQYDDLMFQQDINNSSFLPQLNKINYNENIHERIIGSSGGIGPVVVNNGLVTTAALRAQQQTAASGTNKRSNKYLHGTPGHPQNYQAHLSGENGSQYTRGNSGKVRVKHSINNSVSNKSPTLFDQNSQYMDMSGNLGSYLGNGQIPHQPNQQLSEMVMNDFNDSLSTGGHNRSNYHQTPQQPAQMQAYQFDQSLNQNLGPINFNDLGQGQFPMGAFSGVAGIASPKNRIEQSPFPNEMYDMNQQLRSQKQSRGGSLHKREGSSGAHHPQHAQMPSSFSNKNKQAGTFYSDGTAFTGITATTGATSNRPKNNILMVQNGGPPKHNFKDKTQPLDSEHTFRQQLMSGDQPRAGPVKATRAAIGMKDDVELVIDNRKKSQNPQKLKITTKMQSSQGKPLNRQPSSDGMESEGQLRSHSHKESKKELQSAGIPKRGDFFAKEKVGSQEMNDSALLTQSNKQVYIQSEDLEPLDKPEKSFRQSVANGKGIFSADWGDQFEACNVIRQICRHHQSIILQNGNVLQSIIQTMLKMAENLRSAVSRIALMTLTDLFNGLKRVMEPFLVQIVKIVTKKSADTNQFIADEAEKCFSAITANCQDSKVLQILLMLTSTQRSNVQRFKLAFQLCNLVQQLGNNILFFKDNDKLIVQLAKYLQDASQDVRNVAKNAFIEMSQSIMGQNDLERLLQRVLNDTQYKKVRETLDKEPTHLIGQKTTNDFVITNAGNQNHSQGGKRMNKQQQSFKSLRQTGLKHHNGQQNTQNEPLNIQAKSIINPSLGKQESSGFLNKIASQRKGPPSKGSSDSPSELETDQRTIETIKDLNRNCQVNEWRQRLESSDEMFNGPSKQTHVVETADVVAKLINDANAKIQMSVLDSVSKNFGPLGGFMYKFSGILYKACLQNLGSTNVGVRKHSEGVLRQFVDIVQDSGVLVGPLCSMIQFNSNIRLKPALIDQLVDLLDTVQADQTVVKTVLPLAYKLLDDNKPEVKSKTEKLFKKIYSLQSIGQMVIDSCPQQKLQRVCEICLGGSQKVAKMNGTGSSGKNSTAGFGANGASVHLNSRI